MSEAQDKTFFRNFSVVVAAIAVMMVLFYVAAQFAGHAGDDSAMRVDRIARITAPVGRLNVAGEETVAVAEATGQTAPGAPAGGAAAEAGAEQVALAMSPADKGKQLYPACAACHGGNGEGGIGPVLAGQTGNDIIAKLNAYKAGETLGAQSALMWGQAAALSEEDIANLAAYISAGFE